MNLAIRKLHIVPGHLIIDGNRFRTDLKIPYTCMVKGDSRFYSIAAASVLAKTYRDDYMTMIHDQYPHYDWINNKGYPTLKHREAIRKYGVTPCHRLTFRLTDDQLTLDFS
jgi:ribonuclease HII